MKFAVIGLGFIAQKHFEAIKTVGGEIVLTCDPDIRKQADFRNWKGMMMSKVWEEVTHVSICSPNHLHAEMASVIGKEKIVLCEKPIALSSQEAERIAGNVYCVLQLRHHPNFLVARDMPKKDLHHVELVVRVKRNPEYWKTWKGSEENGGILVNLGIHYFDLLLLLFGNEYKILNSYYSPREAQGNIQFRNALCYYRIEICDVNERYFTIDRKHIDVEQKENLHIQVYQNMLAWRGVSPSMCVDGLKLIERLK